MRRDRFDDPVSPECRKWALPIQKHRDELLVEVRGLKQALDLLNGEREIVRAWLHKRVQPDNGKCPRCGAKWYFRLDGTWKYSEGEHTSDCDLLPLVKAGFVP